MQPKILKVFGILGKRDWGQPSPHLSLKERIPLLIKNAPHRVLMALVTNAKA